MPVSEKRNVQLLSKAPHSGQPGRTKLPAPFVVGVARSGTTLLRLMLDAHPDLSIPPETEFIPVIIQACNKSANPLEDYLNAIVSHRFWQDQHIDIQLLRQKIAMLDPFNLGEALRAFYQLYAEKFNKSRWGDKSAYLHIMPLVQGMFPEARFIHIVRDGRDVASSTRGLWFGPQTLEEAAKSWLRDIQEARKHISNLNWYLEVRYEDLVVYTEPTLKKICRFIDLPWNASMLEYYKNANARLAEFTSVMARDGKRVIAAEERRKIHINLLRQPDSSRIGRWRSEMTAAEQNKFEEIAGNLLLSLGYDTGAEGRFQDPAGKRVDSMKAKEEKSDPPELKIIFFLHDSLLHGAERSTVELIKELKDKKIYSHVVLPREGPLQSVLEQEFIPYDIVGLTWWIGPSSKKGNQVIGEGIESLKNLLRYLPKLNALNPDLIYTSNSFLPWGAIAANQIEKPHIWHIREHDEPDQGIEFYVPYSQVLDFIESYSDLIIANSQPVADLIANFIETKPQIVRSYIEIPLEQITEPVVYPFRDPDSLKIIVAGRISPIKNQREAVEALKLLVEKNINAELLILGNPQFPDYASNLKQAIAEYHLETKVHFVPFAVNPYPYFQLSDVVLIPSQRDAYSRTTIEGMLLSKVVISSSENGAKELIENGKNGFVYQQGNIDELSRMLQKSADNDLRNRIGLAAQETYKRFNSRETYGYRIAQLIRQTISNGPRTPNRISQYALKSLQNIFDFTSEQAGRIQNLTTKLSNRDVRAKALTSDIAERDVRLQEYMKQASSQEEHIVALKADLGLTASQLEQLQQTAPYKFLLIYRRLLNRILPEGTRFRGAFDLLIRGAKSLVFEDPRAFWKKFKARRMPRKGRQKAAKQNHPQPVSLGGSEANYIQVYKETLKYSGNDPGPDYVPPSDKDYSASEAKVKAIAFYLPQFHPIPENDQWWGKGFTEWTNVSKTVPQFVGHYQPRLPGELNFYDLRVPDVLKRQIELARQYGIYGFCFHYYWFNGRRLLERPLEQYLADEQNDFPFCICWANENWTRRWDGLEDDVLIAQQHTEESDIEFIKDVVPIIKDQRYIRIDNKPLLMVYRANLLPNARETGDRWRKYCRDNGLGEIYLVAAQTFGFRDPTSIGFDAAVEFPPLGVNLNLPYGISQLDLINPAFSGHVLKYSLAVGEAIGAKTAPFTLFKSVMPGWDNTPRTGSRARIFLGSTPFWYQTWLSACCDYAVRHNPENARLVFINSWNEWAEGAYLEPDRKFGYAFLQATANALLGNKSGQQDNGKSPIKQSDTAVILHLFYPELWDEIASYLENLAGDFDLYVSIGTGDVKSKQLIQDKFPGAAVFEVENRGRDIAPFLEIFKLIYPMDYKYVCKIHTKKSLHRSDGDFWRKDLLAKLLGSEKVIESIKVSLDKEQFGLIAPDGHLLDASRHFGANKSWLDRLGRQIGFDFSKTPGAQFAAGSMFWFKPKALFPILHLPITSDDFEQESGLVDGTFAHAMERVIGIVPGQIGYKLSISSDKSIATPSASQSNYQFVSPSKRSENKDHQTKINTDPIIVFQMGKVGSWTIVNSLRSELKNSRLNIDVHHVHFLADFDVIEEFALKTKLRPEEQIKHIAQSRKLRAKIDANVHSRWNIITLVREPIARSISTFFQVLPEEIPDWKTRFNGGDLDLRLLRDKFLARADIHHGADNWFEKQLKPLTQIDVFDTEFSIAAGYKIYENGLRFRVLILRLEDLDRVGQIAIREFLGLEQFRIMRSNTSDTKDYFEVYETFKRLPLPIHFIDNAYSSRYARHFYSKKEIEGFIKKWSSANNA
jgi:lipopolysaccharide biosynthesis protein/glycosyltransferase involved in cell wall biosynthesis